MKSPKDKIIKRIESKKGKSIWVANDFQDISNRNVIDLTLHRLIKSKDIARAMRGIYYKPEYSSLLNEFLSPNCNEIAEAIARNHKWEIIPEGNTALNYLGISTQVPGRITYKSSGPSKVYKVDNCEITFKKSSLKEISFKYSITNLIVQAFKAIGKNNIDEKIISKMKNRLSVKDKKLIQKDIKFTTGWIYEAVSLLNNNEENKNE